MTGWVILLCVLAVLILLLLIRLGGEIHYGADGVLARAIAGPFRVQLYPVKEKKAPKPKKTRKKAKADKKSPEKKRERSGSVGQIMQLLPTIGEAAGALVRKIRIDRLKLKVVWGGEDPASAALNYGRAYALIGMIYPIFEHNFKVKDSDFQVETDYEKTEPEITVDAAVTVRIGQLLAFGLIYGVKLLSAWSRGRKDDAKEQEA